MTLNNKTSRKIKLFYFAPDFYPTWRLDLSELFGVELSKREVAVTWSLWRDEAGHAGWLEQYDQPAFVPTTREGNTILSRVLNQVFRNMADIRLFFHLLLGPHYDIIQVRDKRYFAAGLGLLAARLRGSNFICWLSYPFPEHDIEIASKSRGVKKLFYYLRGRLSGYWLYRFIFPKTDHIFVQSKQMQANLNRLYAISLDKMTPVTMGIPKKLLNWTAQHTIKMVPGRIVYIGTLAEVRRLDTIIDAFAKVKPKAPHAQLWVVGEGDIPEERKKLEQQVQQAQLSDSVHFTGFVPMEQAWTIAASAEVCLSPIFPTFVLRSASPTKLNEYMALGRPCIANDHPEQAETLLDSGAGVCVPWGVENFAEAIIRLLEHKEQAEAMGLLGPDWVKSNKTYDRIAEQVYAQYLALLE